MELEENFVEISPRDILCDPTKYEAGSGVLRDVVVGFHKTTNQCVVIKVINVTEDRQDKTFMKRILKEELGNLQTINHPNVVRILGFVEWEFAFGIVMEFCHGGNLQQLILDHSIPLGFSLRLWLLTMIARALSDFHSLPGGKCLVHNDVTLENVLLTHNLVCKLPYLCGSNAVIIDSARSGFDRKLAYIAPEKLQRLNMKPTTELDVYAFGIMTYTVVFRALPFSENTSPSGIIAGLRPDCSLIEELKQTLSDNEKVILDLLVKIMKQCWDPNPAARPKMAEITMRLKNLLEQNSEAIVHQLEEAKRAKRITSPLQFSARVRRFKETKRGHDVTNDSSSFVACKKNKTQVELPVLHEDTTVGDQNLISRYRKLMKHERFKEADHVKLEYLRSLQGSSIPTDVSLKKKADEYFKEQKYWEAMMFIELSSDIYARGFPRKESVTGITACVAALNKVARKLIVESPIVGLEKQRRIRVVENHVIPFMEKLKEKIFCLNCEDQKEACETVVVSIDKCQGYILGQNGRRSEMYNDECPTISVGK